MTTTNGNGTPENGDGLAPKGALNERALLVDLHVGTWHANIKDKKVSKKVIKEHNASDNAGNFNKNLLPFECAEYKAIRQAERDARDFHWEQTAPWIDGGIRILTGANFMNYMAGMRERKATFDLAVEEFVPLYPSLLEKAAKPKPEGLGDMFNIADYPNQAVIKNEFEFRVKRMPIPAGCDFRLGLNPEQIESLREEYDRDLKQQEETAMREVWDRLYTVVKKASEDLGDKRRVSTRRCLRTPGTFANCCRGST
jgi:hypothetical protein